jgi:hypothetical protein
LVRVVSVRRIKVDLAVVWVVLEARGGPVVRAHAVPCTRHVRSQVDLLLVDRAHVPALLALVDGPDLLVLVDVLALVDRAPVDLAA